MDLDNLTKVCFEISRDLDSENNKHLLTYKTFDLYFERSGDLTKIAIRNDSSMGYIYDEGTVLYGQNRCRIPLVLLYMCVHILQNHKKKSMTKHHIINSIIPDHIDKDLFWIGEYQLSDLDSTWVNLNDVHDPIDPGVFMSFNTYGSTVSFTEGLQMIADENISRDYLMPVCVIKTPEGTSTSLLFSYQNYDACTSFIDELEHTMMLTHTSREHDEYTNTRVNTKMIHIKNGAFGAYAYVLSTSMNDVVFDHQNRTYSVLWNVMSAYMD